MGLYSEYLEKNLDWPQLNELRKNQLQRIAELRGRPVLVYASALTKKAPTDFNYNDKLPFLDQVCEIQGNQLDIILETPGGLAEVVEDIVETIREKFSYLGIIVPGWAKSAGTIMVMAADEILMEPSSALGPIDAQIFQNGKMFSAHAYLQGFQKIKDEVTQTGQLNRAYIPILQNISPGELQGAENSLDFAKQLVTNWLCSYKFKSWVTHSNSGQPVTEDEKRNRAIAIADVLCDHGRWKTHARSINLSDLTGPDICLTITDYSKQGDLCDAIQRYYMLLKMSFDSTNIYKIIETPTSQIFMFAVPQTEQQQISEHSQSKTSSGIRSSQKFIVVQINCPNCNKTIKLQGNFVENSPKQEDTILFPVDDLITCPSCGSSLNIGDIRKKIESQTKKHIL